MFRFFFLLLLLLWLCYLCVCVLYFRALISGSFLLVFCFVCFYCVYCFLLLLLFVILHVYDLLLFVIYLFIITSCICSFLVIVILICVSFAFYVYLCFCSFYVYYCVLTVSFVFILSYVVGLLSVVGPFWAYGDGWGVGVLVCSHAGFRPSSALGARWQLALLPITMSFYCFVLLIRKHQCTGPLGRSRCGKARTAATCNEYINISSAVSVI